MNGSMTCPSCGSDVWDNRRKKNEDPEWVRSPDFTCKSKCGWAADLDGNGALVAREARRSGGGGGGGRGGPRGNYSGPRGNGGNYAPPSGGAPRASAPAAGFAGREPLTFRDLQMIYAMSAKTAVAVLTKALGVSVDKIDQSALVAATATLFIGAKDVRAVPAKAAGQAAPAPAPAPAPPPPPAPAAGFDQKPEALLDDEDDLPF